MLDSKVSAELQFWVKDKIYYRKYLCRECGYRYQLAIPRLMIEQITDPECPVAIILPEQQKCNHIFGHVEERPIIIHKFQVMADIETWRDENEEMRGPHQRRPG